MEWNRQSVGRVEEGEEGRGEGGREERRKGGGRGGGREGRGGTREGERERKEVNLIPFIDITTFKFLGAPVSIHNIQEETRSALVAKLERLLSQVDDTLVTGQQKLRLYKDAVCPRLTWDLSSKDLPISWVEKKLDTLATKFLKQWSHQVIGHQSSAPAQVLRWCPVPSHLHSQQEAAVC